MRAGEEATHQVLGRLRFLLQCSECFRRARPLPAALCYVPREVQYKICKDPSAAASSRSLLSVWDGPGPARGSKRATIEVRKGGCLRATGEEYRNSAGLWVKLRKVTAGQRPGAPLSVPRPLRAGCVTSGRVCFRSTWRSTGSAVSWRRAGSWRSGSEMGEISWCRWRGSSSNSRPLERITNLRPGKAYAAASRCRAVRPREDVWPNHSNPLAPPRQPSPLSQ